MTLYRVLLAPWVATPRALRWLVVLLLVLVMLGYMWGHVYGVSRHSMPWNTAMLGIANAVCWFLLMPNGLLMVRAARRLRLPGISRDVLSSMLLYAGISIGVPVLLQFPHGHVLAFALVQLLVATGALLYLSLPAYIGIAMSILPALYSMTRKVLSWPAMTDPRFVIWAGAAVALLLLILAARWRQLLRGDYSDRGLRAPNLINLRRGLGGASSDPLTDATALRNRPDWLVVRPDLHAAGAQAPIRSLRIAMGGTYLPQTLIGRLYQWIPFMLMLALMGLLFSLVTLGNHDVWHLLRYVFSRDGFNAVSWLFALFALVIVIMPVEVLSLRWGRVNAEMPLLALLPGLSNPDGGKHVLLRAALQRPAAQLGLLLLVGWAGAVTLTTGWPVEVAMLLVTVGCLGYLYAMALCIFGGRTLSAFVKSLLMIGLFVVMTLTVLLPQLWHALPPLWANTTREVFGMVWLMLGLLLLWLSRRGWHGLQQRPHPFLSN